MEESFLYPNGAGFRPHTPVDAPLMAGVILLSPVASNHSFNVAGISAPTNIN